VIQETRGWDDQKGETYLQRSKEEAHDYKYFPEPDLPPLKLSAVAEFSKEALLGELPELPNAKRVRFESEYGIRGASREFFVRDAALASFFEQAVSEAERWAPQVEKQKLISLLVNYITSDLAGLLSARGLSVADIRITPENFAELVKMAATGEISSRGAKDLIAEMLETGGDPSDLAEKGGHKIRQDSGALEEIIKKVIAENAKAAEDYKKGKETSLKFLVGQAMREAKARKMGVNPQQLEELLKKLLF
ncbi:MAG: Asp-tRNA(Asn)/Glu-tRNA(Gln) amidotransferase subunit GatB, partial [Patescibacteria group bacterium]